MIRKYYKLIIFLLVILVIFLIYRENHNHYFNYISLGDGYALGVNSYEEIDYGYSDFVKDKIQQEKKLNFYNKSFSSKDQSIEHLYESIVTNEKIMINNKEINIKQIIRESNLITMTIGLNDLIYHLAITNNINNYKLDKIIEKIEVDLKKLLNEIKKYYPKKIYIIGYPNIPIDNTYIKKGINKLNYILKNINGTEYIETTNLIEEEDFLNSNSIYPSKLAYEKISKEIIKNLEKENKNWYTNNAIELLWL